MPFIGGMGRSPASGRRVGSVFGFGPPSRALGGTTPYVAPATPAVPATPPAYPPMYPSGQYAGHYVNPFVGKYFPESNFFEEEASGGPSTAWAMFLEALRGSPAISRILQNRGFEDTYKLFGSQAGGGSAGNIGQTWLQYLTGLDLNKLSYNATPWERGERASVFSPRVRWIGGG